ncbi:MAG: hypothetical protein HYR94_24635 [Chloroflexi bacterium]|nr:hypothetical protein [Chloroflexota bacterium]
MTTMIAFHEVEDAERWAKAWRTGTGIRHEMFAEIGITVRTFRDAENPNSTGLLLEVPDMEKWQALLESDEGKQAMAEDGLKVESFRLLGEFTA